VSAIRRNWQNSVIRGLKASREEVAKSLEGNWRPELLFVLRQEVDMYGTTGGSQSATGELQKRLATFTDTVLPELTEAEPKKLSASGRSTFRQVEEFGR
jgi:hypothetical protein